MDLAKSYNHVCLVGEDMEEIDGLELAESLEEWYLVPEAVLGFYKENLETCSRQSKRLHGCGLRT